MSTIHVVNMVPSSLSGEDNQDSEPNIAVNPETPTDIVATAFTPCPMGGSFAPIYVSTDGGNTWALRTVVPGNGFAGTDDITVAFATTSGMLYAGILNGSTGALNILRTAGFNSTTPMEVLVERASEDQPWVVAGSVVATGTVHDRVFAGSVVATRTSHDRVFVGNNDFNQPDGGTATIDVSQNAATAVPPAGVAPIQLEHAATSGNDGPPIRTALHSDGTVYAAFQRWEPGSSAPNCNVAVVVTRDDIWGAGAPPFQALGTDGHSVATDRFMPFNPQVSAMGQERIGADLTIAVDPTSSDNVWIGWCDRVGGVKGSDWTLHILRSTDRGETWSADVRTIANVKNPSLAVNSNGLVGLLYQAFTGTQWVTKLELTTDAWGTAAETYVLHQAPADTPAHTFLPYIGDYLRLLAVGRDFYGVFCGNNTPNMANFPSGVSYQRNANWSTHQLLASDGVTAVATSIDPFFFHWSEGVVPITRGPIARGPIISRGPVARGPILPRPPSPIAREPPPPVRPPPVAREPRSPVRRPPVAPSTTAIPTDLEL